VFVSGFALGGVEWGVCVCMSFSPSFPPSHIQEIFHFTTNLFVRLQGMNSSEVNELLGGLPGRVSTST
jgi:hypothetical protein